MQSSPPSRPPTIDDGNIRVVVGGLNHMLYEYLLNIISNDPLVWFCCGLLVVLYFLRYRPLFFVESGAPPLGHGMAWGGSKLKAMALIFSFPPPNVYKLYYKKARHC